MDRLSKARAALACALALGLAACGGAMQLEARGTERAPAAKADFSIDEDADGREVDIEIHDLPPPASVAAGATRYAVWLRPADGGPTMLFGTLEYQDDIQFGGMEDTTPLSSFEIIVTAEPHEVGSTPSDAIVLRRWVPAPPPAR